MKNTNQLTSTIKNLFSRERGPYLIIVIMVILATAANFSPSKTDPPPPKPGFSTVTPAQNPAKISVTPAAAIPLEIVHQNPTNDSKPHFAGNSTAVSVTFNQALTNDQVENIQVSSMPEIVFRKTLHVNRKTLFLRPQSNWENNVPYLIILRSPDIKTYSFKFTPTNIPSNLEMEEWGVIPY